MTLQQFFAIHLLYFKDFKIMDKNLLNRFEKSRNIFVQKAKKYNKQFLGNSL